MSEELYDRDVAPKLKELSELCQRAGMPFVAMCEYEPGQEGRTEFMPSTASLPMHMTAFAARCDRNIDSFFIALSRFCERRRIDTGASLVMRRLNPADTRNTP